MRSDIVDELAGVAASFKCEHLQQTGSFKFRGALNAVMSLDDDAAAKGIVAHSTGNHGAAVAAAAAARRIPCTVVVPKDTPAAKIVNVQRYGARVVLCEPTQRARADAVAVESAKTGAHFVHPFNDPLVIAGQGTIGLEIVEQLAEVDAVLVPTSGGGMVSGIAAAIRALVPHARVIACEPEGKRLQDALALSTRIVDPSTADALLPTIADAIRTQPLGPVPWELASTQRLLDPHVLSVSDEQVAAAMALSMLELKQAVEPAGAVALAALLSPGFAALRDEGVLDPRSGEQRALQSVALVVCGGNVDPKTLADLVTAPAAAQQAARWIAGVA